jgi:hypothetical protein
MMTTRWPSWGAASGVVLALLWAPMGLIVWQFPDLSSAAEIERFYRSHAALLELALGLASVGFLFFLTFLGVLVERLRQREGSGPLTWIAFGSALMFMTSLNLALGLAAAARLLSAGSTSDTALVYTLHTGAFVAAAPVALAGTAFFVAAAGLSFRAEAFPRWLAWTAVLAAVVNVGALGGIFSLTGPLNAGDGAIGGPAAPILAWAVWILLASIAMLRERRRSPVTPPDQPTRVDRARRPPDQCAHEHR